MSTENPQAPPSSAEEAAALLGATISFSDAPSSNNDSRHSNPPSGMHSIFGVQSPVPNSLLLVRLCNLREWLRWHADNSEEKDDGGLEDPFKQSLKAPFLHHDKSPDEPFTAARSILAVLMKLLEVTSSVADTNDERDKPLGGLGSPKTKQKRPVKQHKALPPLLSTPIRKVWVHCVSLCISLGSSLPGNQRTDVYSFITKMMEIANMNPRSKLASGGVRHAALEVIQRICTLNIEMAKRTAPYAWEILQCCHRGLLSGGTGEPGHRSQCVKVGCGLMIGCRRASNTAVEELFMAPDALEERVAVEAIKFMKRAASDKYPEVRMAAAIFAGLIAPMLIRSISSGPRKDGEGVPPLAWLEDITQVAMRNLDDESAGVAAAWAQSLARCLCASVEYGKSVKDAQSENQASKRNDDLDDDKDITFDNNNLDFAGKFKAFSDSRRAANATSICSSVLSAVKFLVSHFIKCGGEGANRCGGTFSVGGRSSRIGYSTTLIEFLRLQGAKGEYPLTDAMPSVLDMVGASFEKQVNRFEHKKTASVGDGDVHAPSSPYSSPDRKAQPSITTAFLTKSFKASTSDSTIGRLLTSAIIRRGISENVSEIAQLSTLNDLTTACRMSVVPIAVDGSVDSSRPSNNNHVEILNHHQIQVALVEISHLIIALGEAAAASLQEITSVLKDCFAHRDHSVRLEAATAYAAVAQAFPTEGRKLVIQSLSGFIASMDAMQSLAMRVELETKSTPKGRFRKGHENSTVGSRLADELLQHQYHMHGNALCVSMLMHELPHVHGGVARVIVDKSFDVCEQLLRCQSNDDFVIANPSAVCTCVRAGYFMLSGMINMGADVIFHHVDFIFSSWQSTSMNILHGVSHQSPSHNLLCLESMLNSVVSFLKFCPSLLLSVPDALNRVTSLLENIFPLVSTGGRLQNEGETSIGNARLSNVRSAVMEAYSWLPPGSFPLSADQVFTFAAKQIQELSGNEVICSILNNLINREDDLVDAHSFQRSVSPGQAGHSSTIDSVILLRSCNIITSYEREATLNIVSRKKHFYDCNEHNRHHGSSILASLLREKKWKPTPLHEVGTWREPLDPIPIIKVRLLDSSIQVFAATFGLQNPHAQSDALRMLESLYISTKIEKSNRFNVNTSLISDSQGKVRPLEEDAITFNVTAVLLACLQAMPLHEATHCTLIEKGPPWMEQATNLLLQLIPSSCDVIRRGAAESLSFLATLGVSEDAHTLQSMILHALDEVMTGNNLLPNQKTSLDFTSFGRAGSLLSLACIQRTSKRMEQAKIDRVTQRSVAHEIDSQESIKDAPPVLIMITRLLPSLATHTPEFDSTIVRTHAIHSFGILIANSFPKIGEPLSIGEKQIVWKAIEAVETSFLGAWSPVVLDYNKGHEREKFASEPALVAAIVRLMSTLLPWISQVTDIDTWVANRFSCYTSVIIDCLDHPIIMLEASIFYESLCARRGLVSSSNCCIVRTHNTAAMAMPLLISTIQPVSAQIVSETAEFPYCRTPILQRSSVICLSRILAVCESDFDFNIRSVLCTFLHDFCGRRHFQDISRIQSHVQSSPLYRHFTDLQRIEADLVMLLHHVLHAQTEFMGDSGSKSLTSFEWLLFLRWLVSGISGKPQSDPDILSPIDRSVKQYQTNAQLEASSVLSCSNPSRWQIKCVAANMASTVVDMLVSNAEKDESIFNLAWAESECNAIQKNSSDGLLLPPFPAFYMEELVLSACSASVSASNHSELISVQVAGMKLLTSLFGAFGDVIDSTTNDGSFVLEQYSSQIISAVKHSLGFEATEEAGASGYHLLFSAGCDALLVLIKNDFVSDPVALRRLLKPILLSEEDTPFVKYPTEHTGELGPLVTSSHRVTDNVLSFPSFRVSKLCFIAKVSMLIAHEYLDQTLSSVIQQEFEINEEGRAVHSAAAAIDGFFLMIESEMHAGLTFKNRADFDNIFTEQLVENWPMLCSSSILSLIKVTEVTYEHSDKIKELDEWLEKVSAIALAGLKIFISKTTPPHIESNNVQYCIHAIRLLIRHCKPDFNARNILESVDISTVFDLATRSVIYPSLGLTEDELSISNISFPVLKQFCGLLEDICNNITIFDLSPSPLHQSILYPLCSFQEGIFKLDGEKDIIISSFIRSSATLLQSCPEKNREPMEKALVQFALFTLIKLKSDKQSFDTKSECLSLLKVCLEASVLSSNEWQKITSFTAANELWDAWSVMISALPAGVGIECSIHPFKKSLGDLSSLPSNHTHALVSFRRGLQSAMSEHPDLASDVLHELGFEIFQLFQCHSTNRSGKSDKSDDCLMICAECIKIIMIAYQYLTSVSTEESKFVGFLLSLFSLLVEGVSYNGLPNSLSDRDGADDKIGRMCAQFFVNIARTTPHMFKSTMASMPPKSRCTIEAAVRADMSGYASTTQGPTKKKLNLMGFVR